MSGWKDWQIGEVVTEGDFQSLVQDQVVQRYADASARSSTLGTAVAEGMVSYLDDTNRVEVFDGVQWTDFSGDITGVTAGTGLSGGGTAGDVTLSADYAAIGSAVSITTSQVTDLTASAAAINTIDDGTQGYTALSNGTAGITYQPVSPNYIINGGFDVWQRGTSFDNVSTNTFYADRWRLNYNGTGTDMDISREAFTPAEITAIGYGEGEFYQRYTINAVGSGQTYYQVDTRLEDVRILAGQTVTVSFFARSDAAGATARARIVQQFGSGGSTSVTTSGAIQTLTSSWVRYFNTITIPSISGTTIGAGSNLRINIQNDSPATGTFDIWGVQLEAGSVATPFKRHAPSLQGELAACQRYYYRFESTSSARTVGAGYANTTTAAVVGIEYPVTMRVAPTSLETSGTATDYEVLRQGTSAINCSSVSFISSSTDRGYLFFNVASGLTAGEALFGRLDNANGYLGFSAEL